MAVQGYVNLEPKESRIVVPVLDAAGTTVPLEMVIDTGFTGYMTLPSWGHVPWAWSEARNSG